MNYRFAIAWAISLCMATALAPGTSTAQQPAGATSMPTPEPILPGQASRPNAPTASAPDNPPASNAATPPAEAPIDDTFHQGNLRFRLGGQYRVLPNFSNF